jgi:excisionase family DNA binding protein
MLPIHQPQTRGAKTLPRLLAIKQAIYELGISRTAIYELIEDGKLKTVKIGRRRLVPLEAIEEFIAGVCTKNFIRID